MIMKFCCGLYQSIKRNFRKIVKFKIFFVVLLLIVLAGGKTYQHWDNDPNRGAVAIENGAFGESYSTPVYLDQGWSESDSLWFYNTTQGSGLLPYDFFISLEQAGSSTLLRDNKNIDKYRYLPQKPTFFNPDGLPVGFVKETYQGKDYMGYTCAACHTGQVNYKGKAIRIDGGPAMADMVGFLTAMQKGLEETRDDQQKRDRFVKSVLELKNNYSSADEVKADLDKWTNTIMLYNTINHSHVDYGYARLDAFGRIYNRVLEHVINRDQVKLALLLVTNPEEKRILNEKQVDAVLKGINETIIGDVQFAEVIRRLGSKEGDYPGLNQRDLLRVRDAIFNEPSAPVSYPFLWDITHSDYVQWNGLANNATVGPLGRNTGEVIGVFGILDWKAEKPGFSLSAFLTGETNKKQIIDFKSSIDLTNLQRLESHLQNLKSPVWPQDILGAIDESKAKRGQLVYNEYCASCHQVIDRSDWNRLVVANMTRVDVVGTDIAMARNATSYTGYSGNFESAIQSTDVGDVVIQKRAPVVQVLTAATKGAVATPDADKWLIRRVADWGYMLAKSIADNKVKASIKAGNYEPDTTSNPYQSLMAYKGRSLNGIWATAPYLHNGSVPDLYSLLLPKKLDEKDTDDKGPYRPDSFVVGSRELDPVKVGFRADGYQGFNFKSVVVGDMNTGHEYGTIHDPDPKKSADPMTEEERWDLIEYMKTL